MTSVGSHATPTNRVTDVPSATTAATPPHQHLDITALLAKARRDHLLLWIVAALVLVSSALGLILSFVLGLLVLVCFLGGLTLATVLLHRRDQVAQFCAERWSIETWMQLPAAGHPADSQPCDAETLAKEPWRALMIDSDLDRAVDSFFSRILNTFIDSWYTQITADQQFTLAIRGQLREALARLVERIRRVDIPRFAVDRLLPTCFAHYELVHTMQPPEAAAASSPDDRLPHEFHTTHRHNVHPAVRNRRAERDYLRRLAAFLVPRLCPNAGRQRVLESRVFESLLRELFAQWALLPLMDVLADPNLINLLVLVATNRSPKVLGAPSADGRVEFLARFVRRRGGRAKHERRREQRTSGGGGGGRVDDLLTDQTQLYSFMQYLKREGAVDVLRFYLDVDALNADLLDPKVTTDPAKLSALQQQSEKLLSTYRAMQLAGDSEAAVVRTLAEAHELVRAELLGRWQTGFRETAEYFRVVYGDREVLAAAVARDADDAAEPCGGGGGFRLGLKLKGALRSAVDGAPLDGAEVPLGAWDAYSDESPTSSTTPGSAAAGGGGLPHSANNHNIYSSVAQKLRKERGQRLDQFIANFMHSIEHVPDLGVDATGTETAPSKRTGIGLRKRTPPGRNPTFADLFAMPAAGAKIVPSTVTMDGRSSGASGCLIFILVRILNVPSIAVRFVLAIIAIARTTIDHIICHLIDRLLRVGVYEPRLTMLITTLEHHLFDGKKHSDAAGQMELTERRRQARQRLGRLHTELPRLIDVLQAPAMNKQLMYTLLDAVLVELWPELAPTTSSGTSAGGRSTDKQ